jgi:hypothetical protein
MKKETITRVKLTAADDMVFTNGKAYGKVVYISVSDSAENWHEITKTEYEEITRMEAEAYES